MNFKCNEGSEHRVDVEARSRTPIEFLSVLAYGLNEVLDNAHDAVTRSSSSSSSYGSAAEEVERERGKAEEGTEVGEDTAIFKRTKIGMCMVL